MKNILLFIFIAHFSLNFLFSHDQSPLSPASSVKRQVHQRIISEAYKLLKLQFSKELDSFGDFDNFVGIADYYGYKNWNISSSVAGGTEVIDEYDCVR